MNFIIPKNYKFKSKLFGFIDYQTAVLNGVWATILYLLTNLFFNNINIKFYFFIGLFLPVLLISIVGINNENIISVVIYVLKFYSKQKVFLFRK